MMRLLSAFWSSRELASDLSPSTGDSELSPVTVVRVARHCCGVLGQAWTLDRLSNRVEPSFPHRCTLPHPGTPLFLGTLHTPAAAPVQSVYLRRRGNSLESVFKHLCWILNTKGTNIRCNHESLTLIRTSAIKTVTRVKSRVVISITIAEPTL